MALNGNAMGDAVVAALETVDVSMTDAQKAQLTTAWRATCTAIVNYIKANADVKPAALTGASLSNPTGQPISVLTGAGAPGTGQTSSAQVLTGQGSIV